MENCTNPDAVAFLREFLGAMRQWQVDCKKRTDESHEGKMLWEDVRTQCLQDLRTIFDNYCECSKKFPIGVTFSDPPAFDKDSQIVQITEKDNKVIIVIEREEMKRLLQYTLLKAEKGLKISDQVKIFDPVKTKFVSFNILL